MTTPDEAEDYEPSASARVREQVALYEASGGAEGGTLEGRPVVILSTFGAKSGKLRKNPVMRIERDGLYAAVASYAGNPQNPAWYHNLVANPSARVQDGARVTAVRARELSGEEKQRWWEIAESFWPYFPEYRARAGDREIPILLLEPEER